MKLADPTNPAVGVSKSIGLFLAYFILYKIGAALGTRGVIDPWWAAFGPNFIMLGAGMILLLRIR